MLTLFRCSAAGSVVGAAIVAGMYLPGAPTEPVFWLPFLIAFGCFGMTLYRINGRKLGRIDSAVLWSSVRLLPIWSRILLGAVFAATAVQMIGSQTGVHTELAFKRTYASVAVWICCAATGLAYAHQRQSSGTEPMPSGRRPKLISGLFALVGVALAITIFVVNRNPIDDEAGVHEHLTATYQNSTWYPHLVAVNTYHGAYAVYLDTRDPAIQAAACTDLVPEAAKLDTTPDLYYTKSGHGYFARACTLRP